MRPVTIYWRPLCGYCAVLKRALTARGIPWEGVNIWTDRQQAAVVRRANHGDELVPTVRIGDAFLANPSVEEVLNALEA